MKFMIQRFFLISLSGLLLTGLSFKEKNPAEEILRKIPVQSGGRVEPFESFAREALLSVTGKFSFEGEGATLLVWRWIAHPDQWYTKSFLTVRFEPLRQELGLMIIGGKISPELILTHQPFQEKVKQAFARQQKKEFISPLDKKRLELDEQASLFQAIAEGSLPGFIPQPENPQAGWLPLNSLARSEAQESLGRQYPASKLVQVAEALRALVQTFRREDKEKLVEDAQQFSDSLAGLLESRQIILDQGKITAELTYNQIHPFKWTWIFYLSSAIAWFFLKRIRVLPLGFFIAGFLSHTLGFILRVQIAGRPPVSNMYESIIWVAWAVVFFSIVLGLIYKKSILVSSAAWVATFALIVGESFPAVLDPSLTPLVPVLRNNYWLTVHVLTITLSYGAFALAWGLAHVNLFNFAFRFEKKEEQEVLHQYLYRTLQIGVVLLASGTILGGVWANASWGRFWGWDPKETWALIALLGYLAILHGRFAGWITSFGTALGSALAFLGILMAWYGVNFVLAAGFHSYGFGGGGVYHVLTGVLLDLIFISFLVFRYNKKLHRRSLTGNR